MTEDSRAFQPDDEERAAREELVRRVRVALGGRGRPPGMVEVEDTVARLVWPGDELRERFRSSAESAGLEVVVTDSGDLERVITETIIAAGSKRVYSTLGADWGVRVESGAGDDPFEWDACVTGAVAAVAETGSIVVSSRDGHRAGCMVPPLHIAVVGVSRIVPDLIDAFGWIGRMEDLPAALTIITGPSKTADIEGILVTGVHGPRRVVAMVVEDR